MYEDPIDFKNLIIIKPIENSIAPKHKDIRASIIKKHPPLNEFIFKIYKYIKVQTSSILINNEIKFKFLLENKLIKLINKIKFINDVWSFVLVKYCI